MPPGNRLRVRLDLRKGSLRDYLAAVHAGTGSEVHDVVGPAHRLVVVLDDDERVALAAQGFERVEQTVVVARVQPDGGFIQHVEHAAQVGAELRREPDALRLAAGERLGRTIQRQVAQPDLVHEAQPLADLVDDVRGDQRVRALELELSPPP